MLPNPLPRSLVVGGLMVATGAVPFHHGSLANVMLLPPFVPQLGIVLLISNEIIVAASGSHAEKFESTKPSLLPLLVPVVGVGVLVIVGVRVVVGVGVFDAVLVGVMVLVGVVVGVLVLEISGVPDGVGVID